MGIVPHSRKLLADHIGVIGGLYGCRMMELGNQQLMANSDLPEGSSAKPWFESQGVKHTSVDVNGKDGTVYVDLSKPCPEPMWLGFFDVVTDFGTSEHVGTTLEHLYNCRLNCHNWCRPGGIMIHMNPKTGHWPLHGNHYFTQEHYVKLAAACNYRLLEVSEHPSLGNFKDGWQIHAALQKQDGADFVSLESYYLICSGTVFKA